MAMRLLEYKFVEKLGHKTLRAEGKDPAGLPKRTPPQPPLLEAGKEMRVKYL